MARRVKYKLKAGTYADTSGVYNARDPQRNIVESETNLAAAHPEKFEVFVTQSQDADDEVDPQLGATATTEKEVTSGGKHKDLRDAPKSTKPADEEAEVEESDVVTEEDLHKMTKQQLIDFAGENGLDISGAKTKEEIIKALTSGS